MFYIAPEEHVQPSFVVAFIEVPHVQAHIGQSNATHRMLWAVLGLRTIKGGGYQAYRYSCALDYVGPWATYCGSRNTSNVMGFRPAATLMSASSS